MPPRTEKSWHFDKRLSLDTLVAIIGVAIVIGGPILIWGRAMESRVQALEVINDQRNKIEERRATDQREQRNNVNERLNKLDETMTQMRVLMGQIGVQIATKPSGR